MEVFRKQILPFQLQNETDGLLIPCNLINFNGKDMMGEN